MSTSKTSEHDSRKENAVPGKIIEEQPRDSIQKEEAVVQRNTRDNTTHVEKYTDASTVKFEKNASTANEDEEQLELHPIRHPRLPITTLPRYFVNKSGVVYSNATGKLKRFKSMKGAIACYTLCVGKKKRMTFKLEEIMAYTFSEQPFNSDKHYIFHKDGDQENCAWDNLVVCDLSRLQELEIRSLEKQHPNTKYTVVRNVRDNLTFERYLVSDAGEVYSLITRKHLRPGKCMHGYQLIGLYPDTDTNEATNSHIQLRVHSIVIQSFKGRRMENLHTDHISGEKLNNSFENLAFVTQGNAPKEIALRPLPPVTEETKWKPVGTLPWNGRSFSQYEVSNMGHVRRKGKSKLLTLSFAWGGYTCVAMCNDKGNLIDEELTAPAVRRSRVLVSRLVANAFVDGYSDTQNAVKHLNGDRQDNRAQNLEWISKNCSSIQGIPRKVVASLVDDPHIQKEFPSIRKAENALSININNVRTGQSVKKKTNWNGETKLALVQVL